MFVDVNVIFPLLRNDTDWQSFLRAARYVWLSHIMHRLGNDGWGGRSLEGHMYPHTHKYRKGYGWNVHVKLKPCLQATQQSEKGITHGDTFVEPDTAKHFNTVSLYQSFSGGDWGLINTCAGGGIGFVTCYGCENCMQSGQVVKINKRSETLAALITK